MINSQKKLALILLMMLAGSVFIMVKPAFGQSIPKPLVPEFTAKFVASSNSVTTTDPYTGQSTTKQNENNTVQLVIKNQPIPTSVIENGSINLVL